MKSIEFKTKAETLEFIRQNGGYYEMVVDEFVRATYIVFYK